MAAMPRGGAPPRGRGKGVQDALQSGVVQRRRRRFAGGVGHGRRRQRLPAPGLRRDQPAAVPGRVAGCLAAGMGELDRERHRRLRAHGSQDTVQCSFRGVGPEPEVARRNAPLGLDRGGLDGEQARARQRQVAEVDEMPIAGRTFDGTVLAHRRDHDAVLQRQRSQGKGCEEVAQGAVLVEAEALRNGFKIWRVGQGRPAMARAGAESPAPTLQASMRLRPAILAR